MDYGFLVGQEFLVGEHVFQAIGVALDEDEAVVKGVRRAGGQARIQSFPAEQVISSLLVDEEIELTTPSFG